MRSDFWSLPYAARQAIRQGERDANTARYRGWTIAKLEAALAERDNALTQQASELEALKRSLANMIGLIQAYGIGLTRHEMASVREARAALSTTTDGTAKADAKG